MRNVFDQYAQPENRLTHALICGLADDRPLLRRFLRFALGRSNPPAAGLQVVEQQLPGETPLTEEESQKQGIPDAWVFNDSGWALVIECKVAASPRLSQLRRHLATARRRGFENVRLLVLSVLPPEFTLPDTVRRIAWSDLYIWLRSQARSSAWAARTAQYMEVLEGKMIADGYLKEGTLTVFSGIPFTKDNPYTYREAKRVLGLAMAELRKRRNLRGILRIDTEAAGKKAITGRKLTYVWDYIRLRGASTDADVWKVPHLTLSIQHDHALAMVTLPNGLRASHRKRLVGAGQKPFGELFAKVTRQLDGVGKRAPGSHPWVQMLQRRYPRSRSIPHSDARLEFDPRTCVSTGTPRPKGWPKYQPEWLDAVFSALRRKRSNMQLGLGVKFAYQDCPTVHRPKAIDAFASAWIACKPLLDVVLGSP